MRKVILIVSSLAILSSCGGGGSKSSKSESCFVNDSQVSCDSLKSSEKQTRAGVKLLVEVTTQITVASAAFETLENQYQNQSSTKDGMNYDCTVQSESGKVFDYKINGSSLLVKIGEKLEEFERVQGTKTIEGVWSKTFIGDTVTQKDFLTFKGNTLKISQICEF